MNTAGATKLDDGKAIMLRQLEVRLKHNAVQTNMNNAGLVVWPTTVTYVHRAVMADIPADRVALCSHRETLKCGKLSSETDDA